jgi:hypothetical protein
VPYEMNMRSHIMAFMHRLRQSGKYGPWLHHP